MRVFIKPLFLTLVLLSNKSFAAPETKSQMKAPALDATPIPGPVWPRHQSPYNFSVYSGYSGGHFFEADKALSTSIIGFRFSVDDNPDHSWDYNAEVNSAENLVGLFFGRRSFVLTATDLALYYKLAAGTHLKAADGAANLVEIKRWQLRASAGMGNLLNLSNHIYSEAGVGVAVVGIEYFAVIGVKFSF